MDSMDHHFAVHSATLILLSRNRILENLFRGDAKPQVMRGLAKS
jgi:hypothetical protein